MKGTVMDNKDFKRLKDSVRQMKAIQNGEMPAGRVTMRRGRAPAVETEIARIRLETGLSQAAFAKKLKTPLKTYQGWEQGRATPPVALVAARLLKETVS